MWYWATLVLLPVVPVVLHGQEDGVMEGVVEQDGVYTLAPGPNVEGVVYLRQDDWPADVIRTFHEIPWLDAASIRLKWSELEPENGEYNWAPFDKVLDEVRKYNATHPGAARTCHIRVLGGEHCPRWFEENGVRFYDTWVSTHFAPRRNLHIPTPYDNPEFLKQLREVYQAMYERYREEPLVTVYHGTWSAGPWDEIFHPQGNAPLPPDYAPGKFIAGMVEQLDVLIEELCLKGKVAELPYSGLYPSKSTIDITTPLTARAVERLGRRSPFLYIQSNGWGVKSRGPDQGQHTISWGHERDVNDAYGLVNLAFQAIGTNAGGGWIPQGDWVGSVALAKRYEAAYVEIYPPDLMPLDTQHRIVQAFTQTEATAASGEAGSIPGFIGFRPWLKRRARALHVREGTVMEAFASPSGRPEKMARLATASAAPASTWVAFRCRTRVGTGPWSQWEDAEHVGRLPPGSEAQVEAKLHTDDGYFTPRVVLFHPVWLSEADRY